MTLNPFVVYLWGVADQVHGTLDFFATFLTLGALTGSALALFLKSRAEYGGVVGGVEQEDNDEAVVLAKLSPRLRRLWSVALFFVLATTFLPNSKTIALMVVVPAIINSEPIQKDLPEIYQMAKEALKQTLVTK